MVATGGEVVSGEGAGVGEDTTLSDFDSDDASVLGISETDEMGEGFESTVVAEFTAGVESLT